jgi:SAM-dependent methyltransferase
MSYKTITKASYQATAEDFTRNVADLAPMESIKKFVSLLPAGAKIIDIGCGSGRDAKIFTEKGVSVLGIDFCQNFIDIAKINAPGAEFQLVDIETATFEPSSFDGAWACCSLLHIPKKILPHVLKNIYSALKEGGHFYLTLKKGSGETLEKDLRYEGGDFVKFWSFFEEKELQDLMESANFKILECVTVQQETKYQTHPCIRIFCQK